MKPFILVGISACAIVGAAVVFTTGPDPGEDVAVPAPEQSSPSNSAAVVEYEGLAASKQQFIWDTEHFVFEIETKIGKRLADVVRQRNSAKLVAFFPAPFTATVSAAEGAVEAAVGDIRETLVSRSDSPQQLSAQAFTDHLIDQLRDFSSVTSASFRVLKIRAEKEVEVPLNGSWNLRVLLTCAGLTASDEHIEFQHQGEVVCHFATDEDIEAGNIFRTWSASSEKIRRGPSLLQEVTSDVGLDLLPLSDNWKLGEDAVSIYSMQIAAGDYDNDGFTDIAIATRQGDAYLLRSDSGKRFWNVTRQLRLPPRFRTENEAYLATWFDFDNDGYLDLILGETLYHNLEGKAFERVPAETGPQFGENPNGCVVADFDCDGLLDLYVLYDRAPASLGQKQPSARPAWVGDTDTGGHNRLWKNYGGGRFEDVTLAAGASSGRRISFAAVWLHANDDLYPDLYVAQDFGENSFLINKKDGTFEDVSRSSGTTDFATSMGVAAGDIDGDGSSEIYVANMYSKMGRRIIAQVNDADYPAGTYQQLLGSCAGSRMYRKTSDQRRYEEISDPLGVNPVGWAYAPALVDFDLDGFLDIYATAGYISFDRRKPDG